MYIWEANRKWALKAQRREWDIISFNYKFCLKISFSGCYTHCLFICLTFKVTRNVFLVALCLFLSVCLCLCVGMCLCIYLCCIVSLRGCIWLLYAHTLWSDFLQKTLSLCTKCEQERVWTFVFLWAREIKREKRRTNTGKSKKILKVKIISTKTQNSMTFEMRLQQAYVCVGECVETKEYHWLLRQKRAPYHHKLYNK